MAGKPVPVTTTKTFGCSIKWSDKRQSARDALKRWAQEEVTLKEIDDQAIQALIKNDSDKLRLINVWSTWCGPCVAEFQELISINRMYRNRDFQMITISADSPDRSSKALEFLKKKEASCTNYIFESEDKYKLIEAVDKDWPGSLPYTMLVAPGGKVLYRHNGIIDPHQLKRAIVGYLGRYYFKP